MEIDKGLLRYIMYWRLIALREQKIHAWVQRRHRTCFAFGLGEMVCDKCQGPAMINRCGWVLCLDCFDPKLYRRFDYKSTNSYVETIKYPFEWLEQYYI